MTFTVLPAKFTLLAKAPTVKALMMATVAANVLAHFMSFFLPDAATLNAARAARFTRTLAFRSGVACFGGFRAFRFVVVLVHCAAARGALHGEHGGRPVHRSASVFHIAR